MKNLTSLLLIVPLLAILMVQTAQGQTEDEFRQEFQQYAEMHGVDAARAYALSRLAHMTTNVVIEEAAWTLIEQSFAMGPCLSTRRQLCDRDFEQRMLDITALTVAAGTACALAAGGSPLTFAICIAGVAIQHAARLAAARNAHRACYLRARLECVPTPTPTPTPPPNPPPIAVLPPPRVPPIPCFDGSPDCNENQPRSPIMIDVAGDGFNLTNAEDGVLFNITGGGREQLGWSRANSDDAFLALDLNSNGLIDNGLELFGNFTVQPAPTYGSERNGFEALAVFDGNNDGVIDRQDGVYSELRLWQDINHNGISEPEELHPLQQLGLSLIDLNYQRSKRVDEYGNEFRYRAEVKDAHGSRLGGWAWDVFLISSRARN